MKNAVVTGATGFIGRWLVKELRKNGIRVHEIVRPGHDEGQDVHFLEMKDYDRIPEELMPMEDCVFYHLAWDSVYGPGRMDAERQFRNVIASEKAVAAASGLGCKRFIQVGSIMEKEVNALMNEGGIRPSKAYIYGEAKHFAHLLSMTKAAELNMDYICPILTNPYGEQDDSTRFINTTLKKILHHEPLEFTAGTQMYDFIHVEDAARALILLGDKGRAYGSYLIGSGAPRPLRQFITVIGEKLAPDREILFGNIPYTGADMNESDFSIRSLTGDTGFQPTVSFEDGIVRTMNWLKENKDA